MRAAMAVLPVGMSPQLHVTASQVDSGRHQGQLASYDPAHYVSYTNDAADYSTQMEEKAVVRWGGGCTQDSSWKPQVSWQEGW